MKTLDDFLPFIMPYVPMCPEPLARQALIQAAIEFCSRTQIVQSIERVRLVAGREVYGIDIPAQHELLNVLEVVYAGRSLDALSYPVAEMSPGRPQGVLKPLPEQSELTVVPAPDADSASFILVHSAFRPTAKATMLAPELFNEWHDAIVQGALKRLCAMPAQPFTAASTVVLATQAFAEYVVEARLVARKKRLVHSDRVQPRPLA